MLQKPPLEEARISAAGVKEHGNGGRRAGHHGQQASPSEESHRVAVFTADDRVQPQ
jgi:hypothetical protein